MQNIKSHLFNFALNLSWKQIIDETGVIWESIYAAALALNTSGSNIRRQLRGELSHVKGKKFRLLEN